MKLIFFISFLFLLDLYFYLGTVSAVWKLLDSRLIYKIFYWGICILVYLGIIYISLNYTKNNTPSNTLNNNIIYSSLFFILFISKLIGSIPLLLDDIIRIFRYISSFLISSSDAHDINRLDFLKKSALIFSGTLFSTLIMGMKWGRYHFKKNSQEIFISNWPQSLDGYKGKL